MILPAARSCLVVALSLLLGVACTPEPTSRVDPRAQAEASLVDKLRGRWVLTGYRPKLDLQATLGAIFQSQVGVLSVEFQSGKMLIHGDGFDTEREYRVLQIFGEHVTIQIHDQGVAYDIQADLRGDLIDFESKSKPWEGTGSLQRR